MTAAPTIVCLLGMHRSGTSAAAGLANVLGVFLGPEEHLMEPSPHNPKGYWEDERIVQVNDELLARLGGTWREVPAFPPGWEQAPELEDLRQRARAIVDQDFSGSATWGWKDPRTCLTLEFWQALLPPMRYLICLRDPADVARSLERRQGLSRERSTYLWLVYTASALRLTAGHHRALMFYENVMASWQQGLRDIAGFLGMPEHAEQAEVLEAARAFIDDELHHHRAASDQGPPIRPAVSPTSRALRVARHGYMGLRDGSTSLSDAEVLFTDTVAELGVLLLNQESERDRQWQDRILQSAREISDLVPSGDAFLLVDDDAWGTSDEFADRRRIPFLERDGAYWGAPQDDEAAIRELERLRAERGVGFLVVGWPAFWWLEHYTGFAAYLNASYSCLLANERVVVFDLRKRSKDSGADGEGSKRVKQKMQAKQPVHFLHIG